MNKQRNHLSYKFQRLREALRAAIIGGQLTGKLPGERQLAKQFHANAKTISKALSDLTGEGLLVRQVGRGTFVADSVTKQSAVGTERKFRWITEPGSNHEFRQTIFRNAARIAESNGHQLRADAIEVNADGELPEGAIPPSELRDVDGVVVFAGRPAAGLVADFHRRRIPLVLWNSVSPQAKTNAVYADYARGAYELAEYLIGLGHRAIRLILPTLTPSVFDDAIRGYKAAMRRYGLEPFQASRIHHDMIDGQLDAIGSPAALIVAGEQLAASILDTIRDRDLGRSGEISLTVMDEPGSPLVEQLGLTSYDVDPDHLSRWVMKLLLEHAPGQRPQEVFVPGRLRDRRSCNARGQTSGANLQPRETVI